MNTVTSLWLCYLWLYGCLYISGENRCVNGLLGIISGENRCVNGLLGIISGENRCVNGLLGIVHQKVN